ncbi:MAG: hypothetical protein H0Z33_11660 [Bacillaceae bacterium]|nr:hypothetical protein [Bacillaceae bacterium]
MKKQPVYCDECGGEIHNRDELVVAQFFLNVVPYHDRCFSQALKGCQTAFVANTPINGVSGTTSAVFLLLVAVVLFFIPEYRMVALILFIQPALRLYSWLKYERNLS